MYSVQCTRRLNIISLRYFSFQLILQPKLKWNSKGVRRRNWKILRIHRELADNINRVRGKQQRQHKDLLSPSRARLWCATTGTSVFHCASVSAWNHYGHTHTRLPLSLCTKITLNSLTAPNGHARDKYFRAIYCVDMMVCIWIPPGITNIPEQNLRRFLLLPFHFAQNFFYCPVVRRAADSHFSTEILGAAYKVQWHPE